jgi:thioredoxin-related protein
MTRYLEWLCNLVFMVCVAAVAVLFVQSRRPVASSAAQQISRIKLGQHLVIPGVTWSGTHNLVLALSTTCHFCEESAPFYRKLLQQQHEHDGKWNSIIVFPQSSDMAHKYVQAHKYIATATLHADYANVGITGTPTLVLVDGHGTVLDEWIGRLDSDQQTDVAVHLGIAPHDLVDQASSGDTAPAVKGASPEVLSNELADLRAKHQKVTILDVRQRDQYSLGHMAEAVNIPFDELPMRAPHEISKKFPLILYCNFSPSCQANGSRSLCSVSVEELSSVGFEHVRYVRDNLALLSQEKYPIATGQVGLMSLR